MNPLYCHKCEENILGKPVMMGECYPYYQGEPWCFTCADKYNGPGDEYYERMAEGCASYADRQYEDLVNAGRA